MNKTPTKGFSHGLHVLRSAPPEGGYPTHTSRTPSRYKPHFGKKQQQREQLAKQKTYAVI